MRNNRNSTKSEPYRSSHHQNQVSEDWTGSNKIIKMCYDIDYLQEHNIRRNQQFLTAEDVQGLRAFRTQFFLLQIIFY